MFQKKRQFRKERIKRNAKFLILFFILFCVLIILVEFLYFNFSFDKSFYLSPISKNSESKISLVEKEMQYLNIEYTLVKENQDGSLSVNLKDSGIVILSSNKDIKLQLSSLQLMLSRLTIEGKKLKTLDFRYNYPVVSF